MSKVLRVSKPKGSQAAGDKYPHMVQSYDFTGKTMKLKKKPTGQGDPQPRFNSSENKKPAAGLRPRPQHADVRPVGSAMRDQGSVERARTAISSSKNSKRHPSSHSKQRGSSPGQDQKAYNARRPSKQVEEPLDSLYFIQNKK